MNLIKAATPYVLGAGIGGVLGGTTATIPYFIKHRDKEFEQKINDAYKTGGVKASLQAQKDYFKKAEHEAKSMSPEEKQEKLKELDKIPIFKYIGIGALLGTLGTLAIKIIKRK